MAGIKKEKVFTKVKFISPLLILVLALYEMRKFASSINFELIQQEVNQLNAGTIILIFATTLTAVSPMFLYDAILVKILGFNVPKRELFEHSFIANSFSNLIGFGGLIGAMLRTYFYHEYEHDKRRLLSGIASVSLFYLTGISLFSWIVTIRYHHFQLFVEEKWLYFAVMAVGFYLPVFILFHIIKNRQEEYTPITFSVGIKLVIVSIMEWVAIFMTIWLLCHLLHISVRIQNLIPVFIVASCAGIISMIPGGLGSFDLIFIWGMHHLHIENEKVLVLLLFYRIGYFVLPFFISLVLFVSSSWKKWNKSWSNLPNAIVQGISHIILTGLVFISGIILLISASAPGIMSRLRLAQELLSFPIMNISHQLSVVAGFLLLGLSRGIEYSVKRAYELTMFVLICAALFSIFKGIDYEEAIFLIIVALLLRFSKGQFYRESYVMTWGKTIFDVSLVLIITSMYLVIGYSNLPSAKFNIPRNLLPYVILDYRDLFYSAIIGILIAFIILLFGYLISRPKKWIMEKSIDHEHQILNHLKVYKGKEISHLIFLHNQFIFWNRKRNVLLSYKHYADKLIVLGDPIGEKNDIAKAVEEFLEIADLYGYTLVFYQVSEEMFSYLHGNGYAFFKLGEEALVDLDGFYHSENKLMGLKVIREKFENNYYSFAMVKPPHSSELLSELKRISDEWLEGRSEKGFSLGFFDESYLNKTEIALVKDSRNKIIGFANVIPNGDEQGTIAVDLIRFRKIAPKGTTDYLFLSLFDWAKQNGYHRFNMGMAPLANVGSSRFSFLSERMASQIFLHGHFIYQFKDLRKFKEKYTDIWEPKYLAYRKKSSLPLTMIQITLMVSNKQTNK